MSNTNMFPSISTQEWMDKITADLRGADFEKKLVWRSPEGFKVQPFYRQEDLDSLVYLDTLPNVFPYVRGIKNKGNDWLVRQDINVDDVAVANKKALKILYKGVTSLGFNLTREVVSAEAMANLLQGICLDAVEVNFSAPADKLLETAQLFVAYVKSNNYALNDINASLNYDILGRLLAKGSTCGDELVATTTALIDATKEITNFKVISVNAKYFSNAGAYLTQELAYALSMGNEYMSALTEAGVHAWDVAANIKFNFGVGSNYFMELAKFRSGRLLWAKIVESYKPQCKGDECDEEAGFCVSVAKMHVHAETSQWNTTIYDAHANLLRTQTEAMSAALGGVESMTVLPFDVAYKPSDDFSERIARNQQLLLKEESHFEKITDPAAGSYYLETLTNSISEQAWSLFVAVEDKGGFLAALKSGFIQAEVKASADKRRNAVATRRENLLGTNQYPNFSESKIKDVSNYKSSCCSCQCEAEQQEVEPLQFFRGAEEFEALRLSVEAKDKMPIVFLLKTGNVAMRQARAQFTANFFGCAGFKVLENMGYDTASAGMEDVLKSKADVVVLCSSDDDYITAAPEAYKALDGRAQFVVAGAPACTEDLKKQGITNFVNVRSNVLEELKKYAALV